jgi:hypothetical protein
MSVASVPNQLGYADPAYFSRFFARGMGQTPSEYRANVAEGVRSAGPPTKRRGGLGSSVPGHKCRREHSVVWRRPKAAVELPPQMKTPSSKVDSPKHFELTISLRVRSTDSQSVGCPHLYWQRSRTLAVPRKSQQQHQGRKT